MRSAEVIGSSADAGIADVKFKWSKNLQLGNQLTQLEAQYSLAENPRFLSDVAMSASWREVAYTLSHSFLTRKNRLELVAAARRGAVLTAHVDETGLNDIGVFHTAGPVNVQPQWLRSGKAARLTIGSGSVRKRCPVSLQIDCPLPLNGGPPSYELGFRRTLPGRTLRAKVSPTGRRAFVYYTDARVEPGAQWTAKLAMPFMSDKLDHVPELTMQRSWSW